MPPSPPRRGRPIGRRRLGRTVALCSVAGLAVGTVVAAAPASAVDGSTTVTLSANGANANGRTLVLTDLTNNALTAGSGLSATSGSAGFITGVADNNYTNSGYTVQATMSNLYRKTGTSTYDCSDFIPSNRVSVVAGSALDLTNIAATVQPVFDLAGTVLGTTLPTGAGVPKVNGVPNSLSATQLLGAGNAALATDGTLAGLPIKAVRGSNATFTNPANFQSGLCGTPTGATTPVLLSGTANPGGVQGVVSTLLGSPGTITSGSLVTGGWATLDAIKLAIAPAITGGLTVLGTLGLAGLAAVTAIVEPGLKSITQSGTYRTSPTLTVNVPSQASGDYVGTLTVTLADV